MTLREAEDWLLGLELFGMRFGLDRMRRLLTVLGSPQESFEAVHVVGSNGKSSTTRMLAALLLEDGGPVGAYLSPHFASFTERVLVDGEDSDPELFARAAARVRAAAVKVERGLGADDRITQFEAVTATGFTLLAEAGVRRAVVEAGLGGRWDATNVLPRSRVQVLTNVGLEHTKWLGPTLTDVAREKLAVVQPGATLVIGAGLHPEARAVADEVCAAQGARLVEAAPSVEGPAVGFQRTNLALAAAAAEAVLGASPSEAALARAAAVRVPGRFEVVGEDPLTVFDGAHNPAGMAALGEALREHVGSRRLVGVLSVLDDKDAAAMLRELLPLCAQVVCTSTRNPRTLPPATLQSLAQQLGRPTTRLEGDPRAALALARELAGPDGMVVVTGSLYLLADLKRPQDGRRASTL